jgi:hypothetical protein
MQDIATHAARALARRGSQRMPSVLTIREARQDDRERLARLAERAARCPPAGRLLVAESGAEILAALPLGGGPAVVDPHVASRSVARLLGRRARQLERAPRTASTWSEASRVW